MKTNDFFELLEKFDFNKCCKILTFLGDEKFDFESGHYIPYEVQDLKDDAIKMYDRIVDSLNTEYELCGSGMPYGLTLRILKGSFTEYEIEEESVLGKTKNGIQFELSFVPVMEIVNIEAPEFIDPKTSVN